jgi:hypothetical protein
MYEGSTLNLNLQVLLILALGKIGLEFLQEAIIDGFKVIQALLQDINGSRTIGLNPEMDLVL